MFAGLLWLAASRALGADVTNVSMTTTHAEPSRRRAAVKRVSTNAVLPVAYYDVVELVFRQYIRQSTSPDSEYVFHLAYGTNNTPVPTDFLERFKGQPRIIRATPYELTVVSNKFVLDKSTRREAICLSIREIRIKGNTAEVQVFAFASSTVSSTRFYLVLEGGKWGVKERVTEWVGCG